MTNTDTLLALRGRLMDATGMKEGKANRWIAKEMGKQLSTVQNWISGKPVPANTLDLLAIRVEERINQEEHSNENDATRND